MPQQEFLAVEQRPDDVFPACSPIARPGEMRLDGRPLFGRGLATHRDQINLGQKLGITRPGREPLGDPV